MLKMKINFEPLHMEFVVFGVSTFRTWKQPLFHSAGFSIIDAGNVASLITNTLQAAWLREKMCNFKIHILIPLEASRRGGVLYDPFFKLKSNFIA